MALCAVLSSCKDSAGDGKSPKGDLAFFDLYGQVKSMKQVQEDNNVWYYFDKEGKLDFEAEKEEWTDEETGEKCTTYTYEGAGWDEWSQARPFRRTYDSSGRLISRSVGYEDMDEVSYNEDGTVSVEDWGAESLFGKDEYTYASQPVRRVSMMGTTGDAVDEEAEEEIYTESYEAFIFDTHGNWTDRFVLESNDGKYSARIDSRIITYYDEAPEDRYQDVNDKIFSGYVGEEEGGMCLLDDHGYFFIKRGEENVVRKITVNGYDKETGKWSFSAGYMNGDPLGEFVGTYDGYNIKGIFTNKSGLSVSMDFWARGN